MAPAPVETGGTCPSCGVGTLVKHSMTKLECVDCGYESIVEPRDSNLNVKPGVSILSYLLLMFLTIIIFLLACNEQIVAFIKYFE